MKIEEIIGENVLKVREDLNMSQTQLGEALASYLEKPWSRQAVSSAEKGRRAFTASELLALAHVLNTTIYRLMTPPVSVTAVEMPAKDVAISPKTLTRMELPTNATQTAFEQVDVHLQQLSEVLEQIAGLAELGKGALSLTHANLADAARSMAVRIEEARKVD